MNRKGSITSSLAICMVRIMAADIIRIHTAKLENDSNDIKKCLKDLNAQMTGLRESISVLNEMWTGEAYNAFKASVEDDLAALQIIIENLNNVYQYEQEAKTDYENCERQVAQLINSIVIKEV